MGARRPEKHVDSRPGAASETKKLEKNTTKGKENGGAVIGLELS